MVRKSVDYPAKGRASVIRLPTGYKFSVSGTGAYPWFIYKFLTAPLDANAITLGKLAIESILGYRIVAPAEAKVLLHAMQPTLPSARELRAQQDAYPYVLVLQEGPNLMVVCLLAGRVRRRLKIPIGASATAIGKAMIAAFDSVSVGKKTKKVPGARARR